MNLKEDPYEKGVFFQLRKHILIFCIGKCNKMCWDSFFSYIMSLGLNSLPGSCVHNASMNVQKHERKKERTFFYYYFNKVSSGGSASCLCLVNDPVPLLALQTIHKGAFTNYVYKRRGVGGQKN